MFYSVMHVFKQSLFNPFFFLYLSVFLSFYFSSLVFLSPPHQILVLKPVFISCFLFYFHFLLLLPFFITIDFSCYSAFRSPLPVTPYLLSSSYRTIASSKEPSLPLALRANLRVSQLFPKTLALVRLNWHSRRVLGVDHTALKLGLPTNRGVVITTEKRVIIEERLT